MKRKYITLTPNESHGSVTRHEAPEEIFPPHRHEHLEINLVEQGHAKYHLDDRVYLLEPRGIVFLFPEQRHALYNRSSDFKMWNITVRQSFLDSLCTTPYLAPMKERNPSGYFCRQITPTAMRLYDMVLPELMLQRDEHPEVYLEGLRFAVAALWKDFQENSVEVLHEAVTPSIRRVVELLSHEEAPERLEDLALQLNMSASHLSRAFKKEMGITITEFRHRRRLDRLVNEMLNHPGHDLLNLALDAGFGSYAQFYRTIRRYMNMTPEELHHRLHPDPSASIPAGIVDFSNDT